MSQYGIFPAAATTGVFTLTSATDSTVVIPSVGNINIAGAGGITVTGSNLTHTITITGSGALGTTNHAVQVGTAGGGLNSIGVGATGTLLAGSTGADPAFTANPTVTSITAGDVYTGNLATAAAVLDLQDNYIFAGGTGANVDVGVTTQGTGAFVIDCITGGGLGSQWRTIQRYVQTTDATETVLASIPLADSEMVTVSATINGFKSTFNHAAAGTISSSAFRPAGGNITTVGQHQVNFAADVGATAGINFLDYINVAGQTLEIHVIGAAAETWNWVTTLSYMYTTHP